MSTGYAVASTKQIKAALEQHFAWRGFSVTKGRVTASHYARVSWTNGPTVEMVDKIVHRFNDTKNDDSMTDLWIGSQYTNTTRDVKPDGAWRLLSTFDLRQRMPTLWELTQEAGRLACAHNDASGWGAGEDWLELMGIARPLMIQEILDGFKALGYEIAYSGPGDDPYVVTRYTFKMAAEHGDAIGSPADSSVDRTPAPTGVDRPEAGTAGSNPARPAAETILLASPVELDALRFYSSTHSDMTEEEVEASEVIAGLLRKAGL